MHYLGRPSALKQVRDKVGESVGLSEFVCVPDCWAESGDLDEALGARGLALEAWR
jgi:hypothetical protein